MARHRHVRDAAKNYTQDEETYHAEFGSPPSMNSPTSGAYIYDRNKAQTLSDWALNAPNETPAAAAAAAAAASASNNYDNGAAYDDYDDYDDGYYDEYDGTGGGASLKVKSKATNNGSSKKKKGKKKGGAGQAFVLGTDAKQNGPAKVVATAAPPSQAMLKAISSHQEKKIHTPEPAESKKAPAGVSLDSTPSKDPLAATPLRRQPSSVSRAIDQADKRAAQRAKLLEEDEKTSNLKPTINMVVIGHVDAGKSTLMGHLLFLEGHIDQRRMHKLKKESNEAGKGSFAFAWVMDSHNEERSRGITVDVAIRSFETPTKRVTLLDAPGHRDFIPNMISGASQAEVAVLVIPATTGEFESSFTSHGQTKEHAFLARSLGVGQLIVAVNKLDAAEPNWSKERYESIVAEVEPFLRTAGFSQGSVRYVPVSGLTGVNIKENNTEALKEWYKGPTLIELIDTFRIPKREVDRPFRLCVSDVFKSASLGATVAGKILSGALIPGDPILIMPQNELVTVKALESHGVELQIARAGDNVEIGLKDLADAQTLAIGQYICHPENPIPLVLEFRAQVLMLDLKVPVLKGQQLIMYTQSMAEPATIKKLVSLVDKTTGEETKKKPRALTKGLAALVDIKLKRPVCMELYKESKSMGRFTLRRGPDTVAVGIVVQLNVAQRGGIEPSPSPSPSASVKSPQ